LSTFGNFTVIAGDIGGTKTHLGLFNAELGPHNPVQSKRYRSSEYDSLLSVIRAFIDEFGAICQGYCLAAAGPVVAEQVDVTNLGWLIDAGRLRTELGTPNLRLLNDLEAIAYSIPILDDSDLIQVKDGKGEPGRPIAVVAPGTGLGEAYGIWIDGKYHALATEGGHVDFGPTNTLQSELWTYLSTKFDHVSYERVCSGIGIPNLFMFLNEAKGMRIPAWLESQLSAATDITPVVMEAAGAAGAEIATSTVELFVSILGSEAGNVALKLMATGGVFLGGGIPRKIIDELSQARFREAFVGKGRFTGVLEPVPVSVIIQPRAALLGAAFYALENLAPVQAG